MNAPKTASMQTVPSVEAKIEQMLRKARDHREELKLASKLVAEEDALAADELWAAHEMADGIVQVLSDSEDRLRDQRKAREWAEQTASNHHVYAQAIGSR